MAGCLVNLIWKLGISEDKSIFGVLEGSEYTLTFQIPFGWVGSWLDCEAPEGKALLILQPVCGAI
jgi:hypothetical protein